METHYYTARRGQGQSPSAEFVCGTQDRKEIAPRRPELGKVSRRKT